jgi:hypothetical protein
VSAEVIIFLLRVGVGVSLLTFVGTIGYMIWRDFRQAEAIITERIQRRGHLVVVTSQLDNMMVGQSLPLLPLTTLGRSPTNTIPLPESYISNEHAVLQWREGQWWLEDLNSSNGTLLNDIPVLEPVVVSSGDFIALGSVRFRLELE